MCMFPLWKKGLYESVGLSFLQERERKGVLGGGGDCWQRG